MKVLIVGTDETALQPDSALAARLIEYGSLVKSLCVIVYSRDAKAAPIKLGPKVLVYGTGTPKRRSFFAAADRLGRAILSDSASPAMSASGGRLDIQAERVPKNKILKAIFSGQSRGGYRARPEWLVSAQDPFESGLAAFRLARRFRLPLELQVHVDFLSSYFFRESWKNKYRTYLGKRLLKRASCVRVVSDRIRRGILAAGLTRPDVPVTVLPIFVSPPVLPPDDLKSDILKKSSGPDLKESLGRGRKIILMASRLTREKNIPLALAAFRALPADFPARLVIVGDGPEKARLESLAKELGDRVIFRPWQKDLGPYYAAADIFLNTSNYEGYGRTLVEANLSGLPVITTDVGCVGEVLKNGESAVVFPVGDEAGLLRSLLDTLGNSAKLASLRAGGKLVAARLGDPAAHLLKYKTCWHGCFSSQ